MRIDQAVNIEDLHRMAKRRLPKVAFDFIEGGLEDERGLDRNTAAFHKHNLLPRYLVDVSKRNQSQTIFGRTYASPFGGPRIYVNTGGRYDPASDMWLPTSTGTNVPPQRAYATAVWTGAEMIVWGGYNGTASLNTGGRYDPSHDTWSATSTGVNVPSARSSNTAIWTGEEMIVWGGAGTEESGLAFRDGAAYKPATNTWRVIGNAPVHAGARFTAVWTGKEMIVWGGPEGEGASYDPATNRWTVLPKSPIPSISTPSSVWTGRLMVIWGAPEDQENSSQLVAKGAAFDPERKEWIPLAAAPTAPGQGQTAVWTGTTMLVWGGFVGDGPFASGAALNLRGSSR